MLVSLKFYDVRDRATAASIFSSTVPNLSALFHEKRGQAGYLLSAKMDYKDYEELLAAVSTINAQLPPDVPPFDVIANQGQANPRFG